MSLPPKRLAELRDKVRADPGSRYFLGLAEELLRGGETGEALAVLEAGLEARPAHVAGTVAKARCLIGLERPAEAWSALEPLLRRDPTHLVAAKLAVLVFLELGDLELAQAALDRYAPLGAADPDLVSLKARVADLSPYATPAAPVTAAPAAAEADELVTVTLGKLYLLQGHRAEAERIFRRILRADPDNAAARQALARALASSAPAGGRQEI